MWVNILFHWLIVIIIITIIRQLIRLDSMIFTSISAKLTQDNLLKDAAILQCKTIVPSGEKLSYFCY